LLLRVAAVPADDRGGRPLRQYDPGPETRRPIRRIAVVVRVHSRRSRRLRLVLDRWRDPGPPLALERRPALSVVRGRPPHQPEPALLPPPAARRRRASLRVPLRARPGHGPSGARLAGLPARARRGAPPLDDPRVAGPVRPPGRQRRRRAREP